MLVSLHVKNLALIEEEEVHFTDGLNILTGETGAGKSIILGSVNLALGGRADKGVIRTGAPYALIEMVFSLDNDRQREALRAMDLSEEEDGTILIKRKIWPGRTACSICGETVTLRQMREVADLLIDIYGQRENQKLLRRDAQLGLLDDYAGDRVREALDRVGASYRTWHDLQADWDRDDMDDAARKREADLIAYEIREIEEAAVKEGEIGELEKEYRRMSSFRKISEAAGAASYYVSGGDVCALTLTGRALREMTSVSGIDEGLDAVTDQLSEIDSLLSDFSRDLSDYVSSLEFDPSCYQEVQDRLNLIHHLQDKYGQEEGALEAALSERQSRYDFLCDYEERRNALARDLAAEREKLLALCGDLSALREEAALSFARDLKEALLDLNFNQVDFQVRIEQDPDHPGPSGYDHVVFYISMNPGEAARPLDQIASGGELSRIMLALKTVFAGQDEVYSFIFDEIDTGISGQTAWKVAEKMGRLAADHQILCITHLPQIAAMEDSHYLIAKTVEEGRTQTHIGRLTEEESDRELARLLGGAALTEAVLNNAREMKRMAGKAR